MPSSVTANLLDDGVVDTLVLVGVTSGVQTDVPSTSLSAREFRRAAHRHPVVREVCTNTCDAPPEPVFKEDERKAPIKRGTVQ
jgi:hypothetical protein